MAQRPAAARPRRWVGPVLALAVVAPLVLAGCSSNGSTAGSTTTTAAVSTTTGPGGTTPIYGVKTGTVKGLGKVLVNGQGLTLYLFVPDHRSGTSTCYSSCAQGWPPLLLPTGVTSPVAGPGAESSLLGTTSRTDGTTQVTYDKWPLYLWVGDSEPGQATGQALNNLGGLWYVLSPSGQEITTRL